MPLQQTNLLSLLAFCILYARNNDSSSDEYSCPFGARLAVSVIQSTEYQSLVVPRPRQSWNGFKKLRGAIYDRNQARASDPWYVQVPVRDYLALQSFAGTQNTYPPCIVLFEIANVNGFLSTRQHEDQ